MIIVVDVNVLLSALIKDGMTRKLLFTLDLDFCFPESSLEKLRKYQSLIIKKSGLSESEFTTLLKTILSFIRIISTEELLCVWDKAKDIMEHIDPEDVTIIAAALSQENAFIWSDDAHFDEQDRVPHFKTEDVVKIFLH